MKEKDRDIFLYYLFSFFLGLYIATGTTVLFERVLHFSYTQIFVLGAVYMLMFTIFEVPSGAFADLVGRKKTVALGCLLLIAGTISYGISNTFWQLFAGSFFWAAGFSCISGANQALLYDRLNDEALYTKVLGRSVFVGLIGTVAAGIIGPQLFEINFRYPYLFSAIPFAISGIAILFFTEAKQPRHQFSIKQHMQKMLGGARTAFHNKYIRWSMGVLALVFATTYTMGNAYQPYLQNIGYAVGMFSFLLPAMFLFQGAGGFVSGKSYSWLGENKTFWSVLILFAASIALLGIFPFKLAIMFLFAYQLLLGLVGPILSTYANRHIASHERATVLSVQSMVSTIAAAIPLFMFGFFSDRFGLNSVVVAFGVFLLAGVMILMVFKPKTIKEGF